MSLGHFYLRRIFRLWPAYIAFLVVYFLLSFWTTDGIPHAAWTHQGLLAATYQINVWATLHPAAVTLGPALPMWTLATEEQFYLLWPVALIVLHGIGISRVRLILMTSGVALLLAVWTARLTLHGHSIGRMYFGPDCNAESLLMGCVAAQLYHYGFLDGVMARRILKFAAYALLPFLVLVVFTSRLQLHWLYEGFTTVIDVMVAAGILGLLLVGAGRLNRILAWKPLVAIGRISYALYLWHVLLYFTLLSNLRVPRFYDYALGVALTFGIATASRFLVERPFLRLKERFTSIHGHDPSLQPMDLGISEQLSPVD